MSEAYIKSVQEDPNLTEQQKAALLKGVGKEKSLDVKVTVDSESMKNMAEELAERKRKQAELEAKLEKAEQSEEVFNEVRSTIIEKYADLGLDSPRLESKEDVDNSLEILKKFKEKGSTSSIPPSGSAPLNAAQLGQSQEGFSSYEEMINDLRSKAKEGDKNSELILKKLFQKSLQGVKSGKLQLQYPQSPEIESEDNKAIIEKPITQNMGQDQESELKRWTRPKRKRKIEGE